ncbi:MAG TPA: PEP-CTERM sorting domain-containing protein [Tepidisphaeraceae bacterium]|jgi:hypothetical protein|nr:PEP-CTERM sorting domain-containing protein [Tepidisphaeraceae bacterium]
MSLELTGVSESSQSVPEPPMALLLAAALLLGIRFRKVAK